MRHIARTTARRRLRELSVAAKTIARDLMLSRQSVCGRRPVRRKVSISRRAPCIVLCFIGVVVAGGGMALQLAMALTLLVTIPLVVTYTVKYDEQQQTLGLTSWTLDAARRYFKGSEPNEAEGQTVDIRWERVKGEGEEASFSQQDMKRMAANPGDLVYITDRRGWLGGLKSIHAVYGPAHDVEGVVRLNPGQIESGMFVQGRALRAEKEM